MLALQKYHSTRTKEKQRLIEENPLVSLIIGLKKIPNKSFKPHRMYGEQMCTYMWPAISVCWLDEFVASVISFPLPFPPPCSSPPSFPLSPSYLLFLSLPPPCLSPPSFLLFPLLSSLIPHSLYPPEETELCLFSRTDKKMAKELLEKKGVKSVKKVIKLHIGPKKSTLFFFRFCYTFCT